MLPTEPPCYPYLPPKDENDNQFNAPLPLGGHPRSTSLASTCSFSTLHIIFKAMVHYAVSSGSDTSKMEHALHSMGVRVGYRVLDLISVREKGYKRTDKTIEDFLRFVSVTCWKYLFGSTGDLWDTKYKREWMIIDTNWSLGRFIEEPQNFVTGDAQFSVGAYAAGIVEGICAAADYPSSVTAHHTQGNADEDGAYGLTILIELVPEVLDRESRIKHIG